MGKRLIALDDGHGMNTPGKRTPYIREIGRSIRENEFNRAVVSILKEELERCGFDTLVVTDPNRDVPLKERTDLANRKKADAYIAVHYNAYDGSFKGANPNGIEIYVYPGYRNKETGRLAAKIGKYLRQGTPQNWRGIKEANFHVLRETDMMAVLTENGYMDNKREALLMIDKDFQKEVAVEHAKGICEYFKVKYVPEQPKTIVKGVQNIGFSDVAPDSVAAESIKKAKDLGLLKGFSDGTFKPNQPMTRGEFAIAIVRLFEKLKNN